MVVKKHKQLHLLNNYGEISMMYLKRMYKKLFKSEERVSMDNDMIKIMKQFENDYKRIDNFQRSDKPHYEFDYTQNLLEMELNKQKEKYNQKIKNKRNRNKFKNNSLFVSSELSKNNNNHETGLTFSIPKIYKKSIYHSINYEKKKIGDSIKFTTRVINPYKSNKIFHIKKLSTNPTDRRMKKNYSDIMVTSRLKQNKLINLDNKKRYFRIKNYLNKNDFFFS